MEAILLSGLVNGILYALAGLGIVLIYRVSQVVNFAQGDMATTSTFIAYSLLTLSQVPYVIAFLLCSAFAFLLGWFIDRVALYRMYRGPVLNIVVATLAISLMLNGLNGAVFGYSTESMPSPPVTGTLSFGGLNLPASEGIAVAIAVALIVALLLLFQSTKLGLALRAMYQNPTAARLCGVNVEGLRAISWGLAGVLGAIAGVLITPTLYLDPNVLDFVMVTAFSVVVLGGFTNILGVILSGIILGVVNNLLSVYVSTSLQNTLTFLVILFILWVRPRGLFGVGEARKF